MYCKITLNICNIIIIMNELTIKICSRSLYNIGKKHTHTPDIWTWYSSNIRILFVGFSRYDTKCNHMNGFMKI